MANKQPSTKPESNEDKTYPKLEGDDAQTTIKKDEFGLKIMVDAFSKSITHRDNKKSYVIGLEGAWGSGKSSFVNFVEEQIRDEDKAHDRHIIRFEPWLIGDGPVLLAYFFKQLATKMDRLYDETLGFFPINQWRLWWKIYNLGNLIRKYGRLVSGVSGTLSGASFVDATGGAGLAALIIKLVAEVLNFFGGILALFFPSPSLEKMKSKIEHGLFALKAIRPNLQIIVVIDDIDRLEAHEAIEILRLVKKVADFPYVTYILNFDRKIIAEQVSRALNLTDGYAYIEKIFQNIIPMPPQEPFALRRFLHKLLNQSFPLEAKPRNTGLDSSRAMELETRKMFFDRWTGKLITTPRDVILLHEAIKFGWPHISREADFLDYIWLQLIKLRTPKVYEWVRNYIPNIGAYRDHGRADDDAMTKEINDLQEALKEAGWEDISDAGLSYFLPGVTAIVLTGEKQKIYDFQNEELMEFERDRRLGSPSHWRQYFAFDKPTYAVSEEEVTSFRLKTKENPLEAAQMLRELMSRDHEVKGHYVGVLLDRLLGLSLSPEELQGMAVAFAETMDDIAAQSGRQDFGQNQIWEKARFIFKNGVAPVVNSILANGKSINWMARLMRDAGFVHGLPGGNNARPERQWLTEGELKDGIEVFTKRLAGVNPATLFSLPIPLDVLYFWLQLGKSDDVKAYIDKAIRDDKLFLMALSAMRGWVSSSSKGTYYPLPKKYVSHFMDADAAKKRLEELASSQNPQKDIMQQAQELLAAWSEDRYGTDDE